MAEELNYTRLPDLPSDLITIALDDLEKIEASPLYEVQMGDWHYPRFKEYSDSPICSVCFAGAVMAMELGADQDRERSPENFDPATENKLRALDRFRSGHVMTALLYMGRKVPDEYRNAPRVSVADYHLNPGQFKKDMRQMVADLKREGL